MFKFRKALAAKSLEAIAAIPDGLPPPHTFMYTLVWGGPGQFSWNGKDKGEAQYLEGDKWVKRQLTFLWTTDYYHFVEEKVPRKKQRTWAFAVAPKQAASSPTLLLYAVGFYYNQDMEGTWTNDMWATKIEPEVA